MPEALTVGLLSRAVWLWVESLAMIWGSMIRERPPWMIRGVVCFKRCYNIQEVWLESIQKTFFI